MKKKIFLIALIIFGFFAVQAFAQEKVEVITPETIEVQSDITYPIPYIPVLKGLSYKPNESAILKTGGTITGILVFQGNYKPASLVEFYRTQMRAQGWEEVGSFTSKTTFLAFRRQEGQAFIVLSEGWINTTVRIIFFLTGVK